MGNILIRNSTIVNEGTALPGDLLISGDKISFIGNIEEIKLPASTVTIDGTGLYLLPGVIDAHVHFREPGLTHKADIQSETRAAVAGGVTSFMDMPNTVPQAVTIDILNEKYRLGAENSLINYSFYFGATNNNLNEVMELDPNTVCGIKLFMGSSTGDMLVNDKKALEELFKKSRLPIAAHCEDEYTIKKNSETYRGEYGDNIPISMHPLIRSREACYASSAFAINLAKEYGAQLHILHISTADELKLFSNNTPIEEKRITAEACIGHLQLDDSYYEKLGSKMKVNPAIKTRFDKEAIIGALRDNIIDTIATDHAPHTLAEKENSYFKAPSGAPVIQHSLVSMLELWRENQLSIEQIVEKMCHNPAIIYKIKERGFIREGYFADICLVDPLSPWDVDYNSNLLHKCGWSVFPDKTRFHSKVVKTFVNGTLVYNNGIIAENYRGERIGFQRF